MRLDSLLVYYRAAHVRERARQKPPFHVRRGVIDQRSADVHRLVTAQLNTLASGQDSIDMELNGEDQPADTGDTPNATIATGPFTVWQMTTVVLKSN